MKTTILKSVAVASFMILTACGSQVATESLTGSSSLINGGTTITATPTPTENIYNLPAAPIYTAQINGVSGAIPTYVSPAIATSRTLKVKVTPLSAPHMRLPGYTGYVFPYGCLQMQVSVNGQVQTTTTLRVAGATQGYNSVCANSPTYQVLDFTSDITGNGAVTVTVSNAVYDNCRSFGNALNYGCSMSAIFTNHEAAATIQIESDGTYMTE